MKFLFCALVLGQISFAIKKAVLNIRKYGTMHVASMGSTALLSATPQCRSESDHVSALAFLKACAQNGHKQDVLNLQLAPHTES